MNKIGSINTSVPIQAQSDKASKQKSNAFFQEVSDAISLHKEKKDTIYMGNEKINVQKLSDNFSDRVINACNEERELPVGYYSAFIPKTMVYKMNEYGSMYVQERPAKYIITKHKSTLYPNSKSIPTGFKLMNNSKGKTYIVSEAETIEMLDKKTKSIFSKLRFKK